MKKIQYLDEIFQALKEELEKNPKPVLSKKKLDTVEKTPYTTLISCILSLRTKDEVTEKASKRLLSKYNTPEKIIKVSNTEIENLIYPVGFYKNKTKTIKEISQILIEKYNSNVPVDFNELLKLKGVGRKTANIVMVYGHNKKGFLLIDVHCNRIPNRLGWIKTKTPFETEEELKKVLPKKYWDDFNHLFVKFGQTICLPISPFCSKCPIKKFCKQVNVKKFR